MTIKVRDLCSQVMARPQELPYTRKDILRAFEMFAKDGEQEGYINPEKLEEALVSCCVGSRLFF
jgi:hypothetical protein